MPHTSLDHLDDNLAMKLSSKFESEWMLRATMVAADHGMLLTALDKEIIAVNRRFGEIFGVKPHEALQLGMEPLRKHLRPLVVNPDRWMNVTNKVFEDVESQHEDILELYRGRRIILRRFSGPVRNASGVVIGRLWTYREVTHEFRLQEMYEQLISVTEATDPTPENVIRKILEAISKKYDRTTAILSLINGDRMDFRTVVGPNVLLNMTAGNAMEDSFCQFALSAKAPLIIQNGKKQLEYCHIPATKLGLTRYMGVPILGDDAKAIGTLCLIDGKSEDPLDEMDIQFLSILAVRVAAELSRERHIQDRLAAKEREIDQHRADLAATNAVFDAMNEAFRLLGDTLETDDLLKQQTKLLSGLLRYPAAAVLIRRNHEHSFSGFAHTSPAHRPTVFALSPDDIPPTPASEIGILENQTGKMAERLRADFIAYAIRHEEEVGDILIVLGRTGRTAVDDRHRTHLEAIADQVCLLLSTHVLQSELVLTNYELADAQAQLLQTEKLSVVGTLAASTAHDIRNITASLGLLATPGTMPPEQTLQAIREQLGRFDVLAHRLLSYAKPRLVASEAVNLEAVLDGVLTLTAAQARVSNVQVVKKVPTTIPTLTGDPHQFEHLFVNLILNGVQSMVRHGGTLTVDVNCSANRVRVRIVDTGPGIAKEVQDRLFEPFASSRADGFGLGLYSCKRIVEAHNGTITAKRNPIKGSTFTVELPVR